ncbi:MAG: type II toxin-antitoxin system VapC family toxin [Gemmatimonadetes bacterium]|nr:type II toxin-antitoxin system VapC family toxin [Gemmatimonadota bacterium]
MPVTSTSRARRWREVIASPTATVFVSAVSIWEIAIKAALGRLELGDSDVAAEIAHNGFQELPISAAHASQAGRLPRVHDDPFDRMLVAQAQLEGLTLVSADKRLSGYSVSLLEG